MGRKIEVVTEDNKSEPQEAVTVYRKMISSDKVDIFLSRLRLGRQFRRRAADGARADPDGAVLDPAAAARPREMGVQHLAAGRLRGRDAPRVSQGQDPDQEDRRAARSVALCGAAEEHRREDRGRLRPRDRRHRAIQAGRRRSQRADQQDERGRRPRDPQDRPRRHDADGGQEHQAARPRHADAHQRRGPRGVPPGGGGARRQVLLRRVALAGLRRAARQPDEGGNHQVPRAVEGEVRGPRSELGGARLGRRA